MKVRTFKTPRDNKFYVKIQTEEFSEGDLALMEKFGEPEIQVGDTFTGPPTFTLPKALRRLRTEFPVVQVFDKSDYADAEDRADVFASELTTRIQDAVTVLRLNTDTFTSETVTNI
jgi:hypothetical protein